MYRGVCIAGKPAPTKPAIAYYAIGILEAEVRPMSPSLYRPTRRPERLLILGSCLTVFLIVAIITALLIREHANTLQTAKRLTPAAQEGGLIEIETESGGKLKAKTVILSTGARWRNMNVPGEDKYRTKGVTYCPHCDGPLFKGKDVAVIGGGNSGIEAAIDLAGVVKSVTVLEFAAELKADAVLQKKLATLPNVKVILNAQTTEVNGDGKKVTGLTYKDRTNDEIKQVALEGIFVQIGLLPNTDWLKGTVSLTRFGEIEINAKGETNLPGVFAAGDCTNVPFKQIIIAAGAGATAALSAFDHLIRH